MLVDRTWRGMIRDGSPVEPGKRVKLRVKVYFVSTADSAAQASKAKPNSSAGPLAEFAALRAEILQNLQMQWNIFALQLTATAVFFFFSLLSSQQPTYFLIL